MTYAPSRNRLITVFTVLLLILVGCDSNDNGGGGDDNNNGSFGGSMSATVDGESFSAQLVDGVFVSGILTVTGNLGTSAGASQKQLNITIQNAAEGTHQLAITSGITATYSEGDLSGAESWIGQSGTISIDELSATRAQGTFEFEARNNAGDVVSVTNGMFDAEL